MDSLGLNVGLKSPPKKLQMFQLMSTPLVIRDSNGTLGEKTQEHLQRSPQLPPTFSRFSTTPGHRLLHFTVKACLGLPNLVQLAADNLSFRPPHTGRKISSLRGPRDGDQDYTRLQLHYAPMALFVPFSLLLRTKRRSQNVQRETSLRRGHGTPEQYRRAMRDFQKTRRWLDTPKHPQVQSLELLSPFRGLSPSLTEYGMLQKCFYSFRYRL